MTLFKDNWVMLLVTTLFWCILNESFAPTSLAIGLLVSIVTMIAIRMLFSDENSNAKNKPISVTTAIRYVIVLFIYIFKSAFQVIGIILHGDDIPMIVTIHTHVEDLWPRCLVANGITLTPGTVTIDVKEDQLTVLWLNPTTKDPDEAAQIIMGHFEKVFIKKGDGPHA